MNSARLYSFLWQAGILLCILFTLGCVKRDLDLRSVSEDGYIDVSLNWGAHSYSGDIRYLFYNESGNVVRDTISSDSFFSGKFAAGRYNVVAYSADCKGVTYDRLDVHDQAAVIVSDIVALRSFATSEVSHGPGLFYLTSSCQTGGELDVISGQRVTITASPKLVTKQLRFKFAISNARTIKSLGGTISGVSSGVLLSTGNSTFAESSNMTFNATASETGGVYYANINVFDLMSSQQSGLKLNTMTINLTADSVDYEFDLDLTTILKDVIAGNFGEIPIEVPLQVDISLRGIDEDLSVSVHPWDGSGTGSGDVDS